MAAVARGEKDANEREEDAQRREGKERHSVELNYLKPMRRTGVFYERLQWPALCEHSRARTQLLREYISCISSTLHCSVATLYTHNCIEIYFYISVFMYIINASNILTKYQDSKTNI